MFNSSFRKAQFGQITQLQVANNES